MKFFLFGNYQFLFLKIFLKYFYYIKSLINRDFQKDIFSFYLIAIFIFYLILLKID